MTYRFLGVNTTAPLSISCILSWGNDPDFTCFVEAKKSLLWLLLLIKAFFVLSHRCRLLSSQVWWKSFILLRQNPYILAGFQRKSFDFVIFHPRIQETSSYWVFSICVYISLCLCVCLCMVYGQEAGSADGMFIWLVHIGYVHGGFESKCPIVTIIESVWGLFRGDYWDQFWSTERE